MDCENDIVTVTRKRFVNRIVDHFKHHVMQARAIRCITDVHTRTLSHRLQTFQLLNTGFVIRLQLVAFDHRFFRACLSDAHRHHDVFECLMAGQHKERRGVRIREMQFDIWATHVVQHI